MPRPVSYCKLSKCQIALYGIVRCLGGGTISWNLTISSVRAAISGPAPRYRASRPRQRGKARYHAASCDIAGLCTLAMTYVRYYRAAHGIADNHDIAASHTISARGHDIGALPRYRARYDIANRTTKRAESRDIGDPLVACSSISQLFRTNRRVVG